ncbi:MAG: hypothetical protein ACLS36_01005 [Streptococcus sp.]
MNNPDGTTSYYDAITGVKLVDTSLVVNGQTFNIDAKGVVTKAHTPGFYTTGTTTGSMQTHMDVMSQVLRSSMVNTSTLMQMVVKLRVAS